MTPSTPLTSLFKAAASCLLALMAAWPLAAQLDPRLQQTTNARDFLDLWQGSGTPAGGMKPEILMVLDCSGSTGRIMFHPLFPNKWTDEYPGGASGTPPYSPDLYIGFSAASFPTSPATAAPAWRVGFVASKLADPGTGPTVSASGITYGIGGARGTTSAATGSSPYNTLIKPDGTEVTVADVTAAFGAAGLGSVANWMKCASHVRMRLNSVAGSSNAVTYPDIGRIVDLPLSWQAMDPPAAGAYATPAGGVARAKAFDPQGAAGSQYLDFDSTSGPGPGAYWNASGTIGCVQGGTNISGYNAFFRSRYIEWIFVGKDPSSAAGAAYCIPNAVDAGVPAHLAAVDPARLAYNGPAYAWTVGGYLATPQAAFANRLPNRLRAMAIKEAVIKTWLNYQNDVLMAYRFLASTGQTPSAAITEGAADGSTNWTYLKPAAKATLIPALAGTDWSTGSGTYLAESLLSGYCQMTNPAAFSDMIRTAGYSASQLECLKHYVILLTDGAPSTYAPATYDHSLADFPYNGGAAAGNSLVQAHPAYLTSGTADVTTWNCPTLAGIAAHGGDGPANAPATPSWIRDPKQSGLTGSLTTLASGSGWLPFWVLQRQTGGATTVTLNFAQPIQTMTVGVSLGVDFYSGASGTTPLADQAAPTLATRTQPIATDTTGSKFRLLAAACFGDPGSTSYALGNAGSTGSVPYFRDPATGRKAAAATYFFDGRDPDTLVQNLDNAFEDIRNLSAVSTTAAPVIPFVGAGLGQALYLTRFVPSQIATKPIWNGDLAMFPTRQTGDALQILDATGAPITNLDDPAHPPAWSANSALSANRLWSARTIYTRVPNGAALNRFSPFPVNGSDGYPAIASSVATGITGAGADLARQTLIAWLMGADTSSAAFSSPSAPNPACPNRAVTSTEGDLVGDIVNSTPGVVEYTLTPWVKAQLPARLAAQVAAAGSANPHFRVIFIGTNRGFLHAFGEVSYTQTSTAADGSTSSLVKGDMDELWSFVPTDMLANLDKISPATSGKHLYAVDGDPKVWFLDLPAAGAVSGNGTIDYDDADPAASEKAMVVFGLRKGGRSYYGLDIRNPFTPALGWALVPDEWAAATSADALLDPDHAAAVTGAALLPLVRNLGFSSCVPAVGRVLLGAAPKVRDVLFLGGGYSTPEVEAAFNAAAPPLLGRSALALDVQTGLVVAAWDLSARTPVPGPVAAGLVPFNFFGSSGLVQRAYFTDYKGGLWALGSGRTTGMDPGYTGPYGAFRRDSNALDQWTVDGALGSALLARKVYQDSGAPWLSPAGPNNAIHSMRPAPFLAANYPGVTSFTYNGGTVAVSPAAVGIALVSGDRDNPLDKNYTTATRPTGHRLTVVFDRQDSARTDLGLAGGVVTDANLADFTNQTAAPAATWLNDAGAATRFGYHLDFPPAATTAPFVAKGIYEPIVLNKALFYSYFTPQTATCSGGSGATATVRICDVMFPAWPGNGNGPAATAGCQGGQLASWTGVSSPLGVMSTAAAIQAGIENFSAGGSGGSVTGIGVKVFEGPLHGKYPQVRTWRTVR